LNISELDEQHFHHGHDHHDPHHQEQPSIVLEVAWFVRSRQLQLIDDGEKYLRRAPSEDDYRHIYATMHQGRVELHYLQGKCTVEHLDSIPDLESYRQKNDSFYYCQLYDKDTRIIYDIIPRHEARHVPIEAIPYVIPFRYLLVESTRCLNVEHFRELCDGCMKWLGGDNDHIIRCPNCTFKMHHECRSLFARE
jgi:hypothetical protein